MPSKLQLYARLADQTAVEAAGSYQKWTALLQTMARLYKYPYHEQLMIFAQRPDATACADYDIWNKQMRRYIKQGSSGIALIDTSGDNPALKYVFDVSDTGGRENSRRPYLFQYREEHEQAVTAALEEKFAQTSSAGFPDFLEDIASNLVGDYWTEHYQDICDNIDGSFLEGYDVDNLKHTFLSAATVSSAYVVMARCGLDPEERFEHLDFMPVFDFNTPPVISALGTAISQSSEAVLRQIEITVKKYEREKITERSQNHEQLNISQQRRLPDSQPEPVRPAEAAPGQVREDAEEIPSGTPSGTVEHHDPVRDAVPPSAGDRPDGEQQAGAVDAGADEVSGRDGGTESPRPDEMGGPDEQPESPGGGNHSGGAGVQLTPEESSQEDNILADTVPSPTLDGEEPPVTGEQFSFFPSEGEQIQYIAEAERAEKAPSAFSIPQEAIDTFLRIGSNTEDHRTLIVNEFAKQKPMEELTAFLSKTYHGGYGIELNGAKITAWYGEDGMRFAYGNTARYSKNAQLLSWEDAAKRIGALLEQGQFATNVELAEAFSFERMQVASQLWYMERDMSKAAREAGYMSIVSALGPGFPEATEKLCVYLSEPESYAALMKELHTFLDAYRENNSLMRFALYKPDKLLAPMEDLTVPRLEYTSSISEMSAVKSFITEDEINERLSGGSHYAGSPARIYDFYQTPHTAKEKQNFLKNEYGTGGGNCALSRNFRSHEWFDSKGIRFDKPDCTRIELSWAKVAKYVDALMDAGRYFTPEQLAQRQTSEEELLEDAAEPEENTLSEQDTSTKEAELYRGSFEYNGYHFTAVGKFPKEYNLEEAMNSQISSDRKMGLSNYDWAKHTYSHSAFYTASGDSQADVFRCIENGKLYLPGDNELFCYTGEYQELTQQVSQAVPDALRDQETLNALPTLQKQLDQYKPRIAAAISEDTAYRNACGHSDHENAVIEGNAAVRRAVLNSGDMELIRLYSDEQDFRHRLHQEVIDETYPKLHNLLGPLSQDDIDEALIRWNGDAESKRAVVRYMNGHARDRATAAWLSHEYSGSDSDGLFIVRTGSPEETKLPWPSVQRRIAQLIKEGRFFTEEEEDRFQDVDPIAVREALAERGIVNGELVDPDALNRDPFIQQVTADVERIAQEDANPAVPTLPYNVGDTVYLEDGKPFVIESIGPLNIELRDPSLAYPILRAESRENFTQLIQRYPQKPPELVSEPVAVYPGEKNNLPYDIVVERLRFDEPEHTPPAPAAKNFHITDDNLGVGGAKAKYQANVSAIRLLKELEQENIQATPGQQEILSRYVGWGGVPDAFDSNKPNWSAEYQELKELLTPEEYEAARASTLNAHYTSPTVIRAIYEALGNMGFQTGNILEPAMGVGNFFGMLPEKMSASRLYGVELDSITGRIAKQLYPKANITVAGFETTDRRDFYDLAVGNVPFGQYQVNDRAYNKLGFSIHNYFFAKALDQVRPGGIVAFVTSRYTMDAKNPEVRKYLAQRAELLGAIRLPNNAFRANAGTEVVSDIIFLQKRDRPIDRDYDWVHLGQTEDGYAINSYFLEHPEMVMGRNGSESTAHGMDYTVEPLPDVSLVDQLKEAVQHIHGTYRETELPDLGDGESIQDTLPADPNVKNYSYTLVDGEIYYRENSIMVRPDLNATAKERIKGMLALSSCVHELIDLQMEESIPDSAIKAKQAELNQLYDAFVEKYGIINNRGNKLAFSDDSAYYLLCALEVMDDDGKFKRKADMFFKRTIQPHHAVTSVDTSIEALTLSIAEKAKVDMAYMSRLSGKTEEVLAKELRGVIFRLPEPVAADGRPKYVTADEYLSGNVRKKLQRARLAARDFPELFSANVEALEAAQPKDLDASEIEVRLGATWIDKSYIQQFMNEIFDTPYRLKKTIQVQYSPSTAAWFISNKSKVSYDDITAYQTYGTDRASAYDILEDSLNLRDVRIYDTVRDLDGNEKRVLNAEETTLAAQKQQAIREAFKDWIWADPERRQALVKQYNEEMNSTRPREYDGSHISFVGMNPEITLREHQRNAIAHVLYGGNTLLAHEVGAGKTFEMVAAAMESKRLGLCQKSIFVVPNHLTEQWASEFLRLYPSANILVTRQRDFETANRKKFCARIATGDYDAVIIGHSQFEKIPISKERQERLLQDQIDEIAMGIEEVQDAGGERFTVKQLERTKRGLETRLEKLAADHRKDDVVTFEQLGVDRMFVDEAHSFKNLFLYTKMQNVAGLSTSDAQKSSDMFAKCRYLDEITGSRGVVFATGTPVSNSMTELYTMQRYLQYERLEEMGMIHFDCWASRFGETVTALELAPEGKGYRPRTRFSRFFNLPELMQFFKEAADIKTADQLHLPTPEVEYHNVVAKPTEVQKDLVQQLSARAADVHAGIVDSSVDNMLKITSDGRKLGLDQRIINPDFPDEPGSKVNLCVDNIMRVWEDGKADKLTQLVFCDISTPQAAPSRRAAKEMHGNLENMEDASILPPASFTVYEDIRKKLIFRGVPPEEIAFIHDANTDARKKELFGKVRSGQVRVLLGSTSKMGAGTNVQDRLVAIHDLDCPWRPGDLAQRKGRIERQGNKNEKVHVFRYVTEGTFDAYLWQTVENKQKFISQIMSSKSPVRSCDDVDETALSFAEIKALCAGDPRIKERMDLDVEVSRLKLMKASHKSNQYRLEDNLLRHYPEQIEKIKGFIQALQEDMETLSAHPHPTDGFAGMTVLTDDLTDKDNAGAALIEAAKKATGLDPVEIGTYRGFKMSVTLEDFGKKYVLTMRGKMNHQATLGSDARGNLTRLDNALAQMPPRLTALQTKLDELYQQRDAAKAELGKPFPYEEELRDKSARLIFLDAELNMDGKKEPSQEQVVAKSARPSVLAKLRNSTPQPRTERKIKHHEEVR